ncbi:hypothetical protein QYE76_009231 [Lolium multiflorum]|uniref:F-box domain-containing protein n=1 Tax=Lolium multiflorum TaxID=4521 RepID=A0AAD8TUM6_LOLMU|nr:hypothetical protein QYE76_009231 [Lolium multiflorum]
MEGKYETLTYGTAAPSSSRREDHVASPGEWRDWASLPRDVLYVILSKLPQTDILGAAELVCSPWRRLALEEHLLWRRIDLRMWDDREQHPAGWKAMALAALERSVGRAPLLRKLNVTGWPYIKDKKLVRDIIKKLPLLESFVLSNGRFQEELLLALLDHCPRLELLDLTDSWPTFRVWEEPINTTIQTCNIKYLCMPLEVLD